jgi:hypothetical protein
MVERDEAACRRVANLLLGRPIPPDQEEHSPEGLSSREAGNFFFLLVAICHQTTPRNAAGLEGTVAGKPLKGWDYLSSKLLEAAQADPKLLTPERWQAITGAEVVALFRDSEKGDLLTDTDGRAMLIRDLGDRLLALGHNHLHDLHTAAQGRINELLPLLATFQAYRDPVKKKALFLLALMQNSRLWTYADADQLGPPVDYHEVRGHLRLGTVRIANRDLEAKIRSGTEVTPEEDIAIRQAVSEAIVTISRNIGVTPSQMHYLFWNVFRTCCKRTEQHCAGCGDGCCLVERYQRLSDHTPGQRRCPFAAVCPSAGLARKYVEHNHETDLY